MPNVNIHDSIVFSASAYLDSSFLKSSYTLSFGYNFDHHPSIQSGVGNTLITGSANEWIDFDNVDVSQLGEDNRATVVSTYIAGALVNDLGTKIDRLGIFVKGRGEHRVVFYLDNIVLSGEKMLDAEFDSMVDSTWAIFKTRLDSIVLNRHASYNGLPALPDTNGIALSSAGEIRYSSLIEYQIEMNRILIEIDSIILTSKFYFKTEKLDSLDLFLEDYIRLHSLVSIEIENFISSKNNNITIGTVKLVATFESIGFVLPFTGDGNHNASCSVWYRQVGETIWKEAHKPFVDYRVLLRASPEFRGSIVHLKPNTNYEIKVSYLDEDGGSGSQIETIKTWNENFPEGEISIVKTQSTRLYIAESGTPEAYRVYVAENDSTTIDVDSLLYECVKIKANYIIIRGLKLKGAINFGVLIEKGFHHIIIEDCDISEWGPSGIGRLEGYNYSTSSAIYVRDSTSQIIIQHNTIHHPRGGSNSWANGPDIWDTGDHPMGPQAMSFTQTLGNHVIRYNHCYSEGLDHYFNDIIGGGYNAYEGNLQKDCDIYGNLLSHAYDDGLEIEGTNINIRIWGNVIHTTLKAIATAHVGYNIIEPVDNSIGPQYIWRNIIYNCILPSPSATKIRGNGGYCFYHNSIIKDVYKSLETPNNQPNTDFDGLKEIGRIKNNILISDIPIQSYPDSIASHWFFDYNMYQQSKSNLHLQASWEANGIFDESPVFDIENTYSYYLQDGSRGIDEGGFIPNFNDLYFGSAPDIGACERNVFDIPVGPHSDTANSAGLEESIEESKIVDGISISPNPFNPSLNISFNTKFKLNIPITISVYDMMGRLVFTKVTKKSSITWNASKSASGIYMVRVVVGAKAFVKRAILLK